MLMVLIMKFLMILLILLNNNLKIGDDDVFILIDEKLENLKG